MIEIDTWQEIFDTVRKNKLRTFLTGFSVAWGILMLIVLLGSGQGLSKGVEYGFRDDATNAIWMRSGQTSVPWKGLRPGRNVQFTNEDYDVIREGREGSRAHHLPLLHPRDADRRLARRDLELRRPRRPPRPPAPREVDRHRGALPQPDRRRRAPEGRRHRRAREGPALQGAAGDRRVPRDQGRPVPGRRGLHRHRRRGGAGEDLHPDLDRPADLRRREQRRDDHDDRRRRLGRREPGDRDRPRGSGSPSGTTSTPTTSGPSSSRTPSSSSSGSST